MASCRTTYIRVSATVVAGAVAASIWLARPVVAAAQSCIGDCNENGRVDAEERLRMVNIAFDRASVSACFSGDADHDGRITAPDIVVAIGKAIRTCFADSADTSAAAASAVTLQVESANALPSQQVSFEVSFSSGAAGVAGLQNDLSFDPVNTPIAAAVSPLGTCPESVPLACGEDSDCLEGSCAHPLAPDCSLHTGIGKQAFFSFIKMPGCSFPNCACTIGSDCTAMRAIVAGVDPLNLDPIPDGPLYSCRVNVSPLAVPNEYPLTLANVFVSDPVGQLVCASNSDPACGATPGAIHVDAVTPMPDTATPTPEATITPTPTAAQCGNGVIEAGEECDLGGVCTGGEDTGLRCDSESDCRGDGVCAGGDRELSACADDSECFDSVAGSFSKCIRCKTFGGRPISPFTNGLTCAANCTIERAVEFPFVPGFEIDGQPPTLLPGTSGSLVHGQSVTIPVPFTGSQTLTVGKPKDGIIPVVIKADSIRIPAIAIHSSLCTCVRGVAQKRCGGVVAFRDDTPSPNCTEGFADPSICPPDKPCAPVLGEGNTGAGVVDCVGELPGINLLATQDSSGAGAPQLTRSGFGPPGSALLLTTNAVGRTFGACTGAGFDYGGDGTFCTDDDPFSARGSLGPPVATTTGRATALVQNRNGRFGANLGPFSVAGATFSCADLSNGIATPGAGLVSAYTQLDVEMLRDVVVTSALFARGTPPPTPTPTVGLSVCGNQLTEVDEECDDGGTCIGGPDAGLTCRADDQCRGFGVCDGGPRALSACAGDDDCPGSTCVHCKTFGGDGCAANCTNESLVVSELVAGRVLGRDIQAGTSGVVAHGDVLTVPMPLSGRETFVIGGERNGIVPLVIRADSVNFTRFPASNFACNCMRGIAQKRCGGVIYKLDGTTAEDCSDGVTAGPSVCPPSAPCAFVFGPNNSGAGVIGCDVDVAGVNVAVTQDVGGSSRIIHSPVTTRSGSGPPGSALIFSTNAIDSVIGSCTGVDEPYGPDGQFCTADDAFSARGTAGVPLLLTNGASSATLFGPNQIDDETIGPFTVSGAFVNCTDLANGSLAGGGLASAFTSLSSPILSGVGGDLVVTNTLFFQDPTSPTVTPTGPTPTRPPFPPTATRPPLATGTPVRTMTRTPTFFPFPTFTPAPPQEQVRIDIGSVTGAPGQRVRVPVTIRSSGVGVVATANDIIYRSDLFDLDLRTCAINPAIGKRLVIDRLPPGFDPSNTTVHASVLSLDDGDAIPDGVLYSCVFTIKAIASPGSYVLFDDFPQAFARDGSFLPVVLGDSGDITVSLVGPRCSADCDGDGAVTTGDLLAAVRVALGAADGLECPNADRDLSGRVGAEEIVRGVGAARDLCAPFSP